MPATVWKVKALRPVSAAEANLDPTPIWAIIAPGNHASLRLADRLGFEAVSEILYNGEPTIVLKRAAWLPAAAAAAAATAA